MKSVFVECESCDGTGIYRGFAEPPGVGVICLTCHGKGGYAYKYKPFKERKRRKDVKMVRLSRGTFLATGVGPSGNGIPYEKFLAGKMPR